MKVVSVLGFLPVLSPRRCPTATCDWKRHCTVTRVVPQWSYLPRGLVWYQHCFGTWDCTVVRTLRGALPVSSRAALATRLRVTRGKDKAQQAARLCSAMEHKLGRQL